MRRTDLIGCACAAILLGPLHVVFAGTHSVAVEALVADAERMEAAASIRPLRMVSADRIAEIGRAALPESAMSPGCPSEMVDMAGYCIDRNPTRTFVNWYEAADQCQALGKRLCTNSEWLQACDAAPLNGVEEIPGQQSEWLANWVFEPSDQVFDAIERGYFRCRTTSHPWPSYRPYQIKWFRCCACNSKVTGSHNRESELPASLRKGEDGEKVR